MSLPLLTTPPEYRFGRGVRCCGSCGAYQPGWCRMFAAVVASFGVCREWYPHGGS